MILVYCQKVSNRIAYAVGLLIDTILGMEYKITTRQDEFMAFEGAKICYNAKALTTNALYIQPSGFLSERGIRHFEPRVEIKNELPILFPSRKPDCHLQFDVFSAAFYLVSRYEEYLPFVKDCYGRFEAPSCLAFRHGFLHRPVVDLYAQILRKKLGHFFPSLLFPDRSFCHIPTIDVDVAYAYKGRGLLRSLYGVTKDMVHADFSALRERYRVLAGIERDPFDTYDMQIRLHKKFGLKASYFFLCGDYGYLDKNISFYSPIFQKLVKMIGDYAFVGLHPSAASNIRPNLLAREIERLSTVLKRPVKRSRQHFLMLSFPKTYQILLQYNIFRDFSMGYASRPGFRAGTCTPFYFYDLDREAITRLKVIPLTVMDGSLRDYMGLTPEQSLDTIYKLIAEVKSVNGTFVSLWHNDAFSDAGQWKGWRQVYEKMLDKLHGQ